MRTTTEVAVCEQLKRGVIIIPSVEIVWLFDSDSFAIKQRQLFAIRYQRTSTVMGLLVDQRRR